MLHNKAKLTVSFLLIFLLLFSLCSCRTFEIDVNIFSNIEECKDIENLKSDNADVEIYDSTMEDKYLKNLKFQGSFGCKYTSDDLTFELFAYEFSSVDMAMSYFKNSTGKGNDPNPTFSDSSGAFLFERIVIKENKAYAVRCKKDEKEKLIDFLNSWFSVDVITQGTDNKGNHGNQGTVL